MYTIKVTRGEYTGRIFTTNTVSTDERYAQVTIGRNIVEFKLGFDCVWYRG